MALLLSEKPVKHPWENTSGFSLFNKGKETQPPLFALNQKLPSLLSIPSKFFSQRGPRRRRNYCPIPSVTWPSAQMTACPCQKEKCFRGSCPTEPYFFVLLVRNGQKRGGKGGRGQVSVPLHTGTQAAPREETLHRGLLLDPGRKRRPPFLTTLMWRFNFSHGDVFLFLLKGEENDPDQQSDSEEGSNKGEPQVSVQPSAFLPNMMTFLCSRKAQRGFGIL